MTDTERPNSAQDPAEDQAPDTLQAEDPTGTEETADSPKMVELVSKIILEGLLSALADITSKIEKQPATEETRQELADSIINSELWEQIRDMIIFVEEKADSENAKVKELKQLESLLPYLLEELRKDPYKNLPPATFTGEPDNEQAAARFRLLDKAYEAARAAKEADEKEQLPQVRYKHSRKVELSVDKAPSVYFGGLMPKPKPTDIDGQRTFVNLGYERAGSPEITLETWYSFNSDMIKRLGVKKEIDEFDFFIELAIYNMFINGNKVVSYTQIFKWLNGSNKTPSTAQLDKIDKSVQKQMSTIIMINNKAVLEAWKVPGDKYEEPTGPMLPVFIIPQRYRANGKIADGYIEILKAPPLLTIGKEIGQVTTVPKALLENDIKHSKWYYPVMHYLMANIARMKDGQRNRKIIYSTLYEAVGAAKAADSVQRNVKAKLFEILDYFINCGWITGYLEEVTPTTGEIGVIISFNKKLATHELPDKKKARKQPKKRSNSRRKDSDILEKR